MKRIRSDAVLRRFLSGQSIGWIASMTFTDMNRIESIIRRALNRKIAVKGGARHVRAMGRCP